MDDANFDKSWVFLCRQGSCDEPESAEYQRVKKEWIAADRPTAIAAFIIEAANRPPSKGGHKEALKHGSTPPEAKPPGK